MQSINTLSLAPDVNDWLANSRHPRILHVFDHACNLINEHREVLSIVTPQVGNGPFNLVIEDDIFFFEYLNGQSTISIRADQLNLGTLAINTANAKLWSPRPDWERLHASRENILNHLTPFPITKYQPSILNSLISNLSLSIAAADIPSALAITFQLAGLGNGLTPAGDDSILGAVLAAWIIHPLEVAGYLAEQITNTAAPLTTSLSAAWLRSAGKGEAGILWHQFFDALISRDEIATEDSIEKILAVGATSGADALAGFIGTFRSWAELTSPKIS